ncbi:hypothetical protein BCR37DRAFT_253978 [Protomyces lactucae-debilis]|uniref:F-box domain-containing protein n=1 Tax=Protomyces lactucae-debilis TaxID=2754530 RepID=A0A1Y2FMS2_PROLT|nr:uncharacterized protein BCR37DRAFT_253978 [Protomyces lactucae-debilis]ORY84887.1 hypothetical protein BCR37DRAFT_253978 [Protomyces lactucae-debilis]
MNAAGASAQPSAAKKRKPSKKAQAAAECKAAEDLSAQLQLEADEEAARAKDYFTLLPYELLSHIFSYLDPISLFKLQGISTFFQEHLKRSDRLFETKCKDILALQHELPTYMTHRDLLRLTVAPICQFCASARGNSRPYVPYNYVACRPCFEDRTISFQQAIATAEELTGLGPDCVLRLVENCIYASDQPFHRNMPPRNSRFRVQDVEDFCGAFIDSGRSFAAFLEDEKRNLAVGLKARRDIEIILTNRGNISTLARQHSLYARKFCICQRIYMIFNETNIEEELAKYVPNMFETFFSRTPPYISTKEDVRLYSDKLKTRLESERRIAKKQRQCNAAINFINELVSRLNGRNLLTLSEPSCH